MKSKRFLRTGSLLLALVLSLALSITSAAANADNEKEIVILHTNDIHCAVDGDIGLAGVAAYKKELQKQYGEQNVLLVDAGDAVQGGVIGTLSDGLYPLELMNAAGFDLAIPGNHEFDYGFPQFLTITKQAGFSYICSNLMELSTGKTLLPAYELLDCGSVKLGFVGITTPSTITKSAPTFFKDGSGKFIYGFCQGGDGQELYTAVQKAVDEAREAGADYVIAIGHMGINGAEPKWRSTAVIANTTGIDLFIDGHSHEQYETFAADKSGRSVPLAQTGTGLQAVGKAVIDTESGKISNELVGNITAKDPTVQNKLNEIQKKYQAEINRVVAKSSVTLTDIDPVTKERLVRTTETNLGDLCADAYRAATGADIAFMNGGGIRASIAAGDITYGDIINVNPYNNSICMVELTGQLLLDALEFSARLQPEESGAFLHASGLTYTIDMSVPTSVELDSSGSFARVAGEYRVKDVKVGGAALDTAKTYTLASHNYMLKEGGDGFSMFSDCSMPLDEIVLDNQALIHFIADDLKGVVGEEYANPYGQGRITIINAGKKALPMPTASVLSNAVTGAAA